MTSQEHTEEVTYSYRDLHSPCTIYRVQKTTTHTMYTKDGLKHRVDGPAMIAGDKEWFYIDGYLKTPNQHKLYRELLNNYGPSSKEEGYYSKAMESTTSIYTLSTNE